VGGGATGDSSAAIRALLAAGVTGRALACVVDPEAASLCHAAGQGAHIALALGHKLDPRWGNPLHAEGRVATLTDGKFTYSGGIWAGLTGDLGPSACVRIGSIEAPVASRATYDWADEQYRSLGMDAGGAKFIVVKNPMNYRVGYAGMYQPLYVLDTPGPTPVSLRHVQYQRLQRPFFPADSDIPNFQPRVLRGRRYCGRASITLKDSVSPHA